jgi:hypothetical protein
VINNLRWWHELIDLKLNCRSRSPGADLGTSPSRLEHRVTLRSGATARLWLTRWNLVSSARTYDEKCGDVHTLVFDVVTRHLAVDIFQDFFATLMATSTCEPP